MLQPTQQVAFGDQWRTTIGGGEYHSGEVVVLMDGEVVDGRSMDYRYIYPSYGSCTVLYITLGGLGVASLVSTMVVWKRRVG